MSFLMKIKRASGVKRVLYGTAAAGALLASSVSADEVTAKLSTTETEKTIMSKDGSASTNNVLQTVQLSTSGSQPLPEGSKIVITLTPKQTISRITSQFRQKDVSLVDTKLKYIDNYHYELDVSGTEPGKLRDYVFDLGNYVSSIRDLDFGVTYDLTIGGKSVSKVDTMLHVRKEVAALNLEDASGSYNQVTNGKQVIKSSYENGKANVGNLSLKEMTKAVENAVGRYTNMTLDVTVPENVTLRSEQLKEDGTKTIGHNALAKYRSGNTYHIPFSELDGRSDKFVYDAIDYYFDGEPLVDKSQLPMDEAKTTSTVFDNIVVGAHYSDDKSLSSSITAQAPIKFTLWANTRPLSEGRLQMAVTSDVLSNVATYEKPSMNVRLSVKGELPVSFSESTDITLTDSSDLRRRKLTISGGVKTRFIVKDAKTQTVLKELGSNESYVVPDTVDKITITPKDKISIYDWESTVKPKDAETDITYTFDVSSADDVALTKRLTRTPEIVNQISAKVDGMSDGATHSLYKSKVRVQLQNNEQFYFLTKNGQGANIGNDPLSGSKPIMSPLTLLEEFTPSFRSNDLRKLSNVIQNAQFKMTLPEGVSVIPDNSAFKVISQNGRDVILSLDKETSKWYQSYDYGKDNTIDGLLKFALNVPYKAATYRIPFEMISHNDNVTDEGSVKKSILTITTATVREALSTSDVDNNGEAVTDFVLSNGNFVTVHSNLTNATQAPINKWESLAYIPQKGIEGSTATAKLKGAITAPKGWKVLYTTDKVSGNREADGKLNFTETLSDFSRVTAVKYVATEPVVKSSTVTFNIPLETPNEPGAKYVYRTDITTDTVSHILSAPVSISAKEAELKTRYLEKDTNKVLSPE